MKRHADQGQRSSVWSAGAALLALTLAACGTGSETGPGGVSEGEARALDEAAEKLDKQQLPESAVPPVDLPVAQQGPAPAEQPAPKPSDSAE